MIGFQGVDPCEPLFKKLPKGPLPWLEPREDGKKIALYLDLMFTKEGAPRWDSCDHIYVKSQFLKFVFFPNRLGRAEFFRG